MGPNVLRSIAVGLVLLGVPSLAAPPAPDSPGVLVLQAPPSAAMSSVAVSPDGSLVATAAEGGVRLYDARTGALVRAIGAGGDRSVVFSPDGRSLTAAGFHMDKIVGVYDVATGKRLRALAGQAEWEAYATAFSPDGRLLASSSAVRQVLVWDLATGTIRHRLEGQTSPITALAFSPDGATLAGGGAERTILLWDTASGRLRRSLEGHRDWVCTLAFSPDGRTIASGSCDWAYHRGRDTSYFSSPDPGCVSQWILWDVDGGAPRRTVAEAGRLRSLALAPDGRSLACGVGKDVRLYDLGAESAGRVLTSHQFDVTSVAFTPDGAAVVSGSHDLTARRVAVATGRVEWQAPGNHVQVNSVALAPDGSLLATGGGDHRFAHRVLPAGAPGLGPGAVRLWDARTGRLLRKLGDPAEQVMAVALAPDGRRVAAGGAAPDGSGIVRVWDAPSGAPAWSAGEHSAEVLAVAYAPDGATLATAGADGLVRLRDARTGALVRTLEGHDGGATSLAFSADGAVLVCGDGRGGARVWDPRAGRLLRTCRVPGSGAATVATDRLITSVAIGPDGGTFLVCSATIGNTYGDPTRLWDTRTGALVRQFDNPAHGGRPIALSPDGTILAAGGKSVRLVDVRTGASLREFTGHLKKTQSIAFSADGRLVFAGGSYGTTNAWEVASGRLLVTLFAFPNDREGTSADDWLAYRPDGSYDGSPGVERYLAWRVGDELRMPGSPGAPSRREARLESALAGPFPKAASP